MLDPAAGFKSSDSFADPPAPLESGDSFADRSPPGTSRSNLNLRLVPTMLAPQQPSKVVTVAQIAAPQGWRGLI